MSSPPKKAVVITRSVDTGMLFRGKRVLIEARPQDTLAELDRAAEQFLALLGPLFRSNL